jgi:hypothetical protein
MNTQKDEKAKKLVEKLQFIQTKLTDFENNYDSKFNHLEKRKHINESLDKKLAQIKKNQNEKIQLVFGDIVIWTTKSKVNQCRLDNILKNKVNNGETKIVLDYPLEYIKRALHAMGMLTNDYTKKLKILIRQKMNEEIMKSVLKSFFIGEDILSNFYIEVENTELKNNFMSYLFKREEVFVAPVVVVNDYNYNRGANYNYNGY